MKKAENTSNNTLFNLWNNSNFAFWVLLFILFCSAVYVLRSVLLPFVLGIILGYLFDPLALKFEKLKFSRTLATVFVFIVVVLVAIPTLALLANVVNSQLSVLITVAPRYVADFAEKIEPVFQHLQEYFPSLQVGTLKETFFENMAQTFQFGGKILQGLFKNGMAFINVISLMFITPVVAFYMLRDWDMFVKKVDNLLPRHSQKNIRHIFKQIDKALSGFIRGQLSVCIILGVYYAVFLKVIGLELGVLVGFIAGLISFVPYVGSITGFILSSILALSQFNGFSKLLGVIFIFLVGQFIEGNFLTPKLVGNKVGLHPVWVMFALLAGGVLLGFLGLMIAVPVAAVIRILLDEAIEKYKKSTLYMKT